MTRTLVIYGDQTLGGAIGDGITSAELEQVRAENRRLNAVNGVRSEGDLKRWRRQQRRLARKYTVQPVGRLRGAVLGVYGLVVLYVAAAWRYLDEWNREGHRGRFKV